MTPPFSLVARTADRHPTGYFFSGGFLHPCVLANRDLLALSDGHFFFPISTLFSATIEPRMTFFLLKTSAPRRRFSLSFVWGCDVELSIGVSILFSVLLFRILDPCGGPPPPNRYLFSGKIRFRDSPERKIPFLSCLSFLRLSRFTLKVS